MRQIRVVKACVIRNEHSWVAPSIEGEGEERLYRIEVHTLCFYNTDYRVTSLIRSKGVEFLCGSTRMRRPDWEVEIFGVKSRVPRQEACPIAPITEPKLPAMLISKFERRIYFDSEYRPPDLAGPIEFDL